MTARSARQAQHARELDPLVQRYEPLPPLEQPAPTVFLDRDGVINRRIIDDYVTNLKELEWLPGTVKAIADLSRAGFRTVVVTNQRGLAVGRMTADDLAAIHRHMWQTIAQAGGSLATFYVCPHDRNSGCPCRKPRPGLLERADLDRPVDWRRSFLIGDSNSDIAAGRAKSVTTIKVAGSPSDPAADHYLEDLPAAVQWLSRHFHL